MPTFRIQSNPKNGNLNFKLIDHLHLSSNLGGVMGGFLTEGAYRVIKDDKGNGGLLVRLIYAKYCVVDFSLVRLSS